MATILLVDDESDYRSVLADRLQHAGYTTLEADDGDTGIEAAKSQKPDLLILDLMMPHLSGYQVWSYFQRNLHLKNIPILIVTAKYQASDVFWGKAMSAKDFINKTTPLDQILARVAERLEEAEYEKKLEKNRPETP